MDKPAFDPSKPYQEAKPAFNPNAPHEVVDHRGTTDKAIDAAKNVISTGLKIAGTPGGIAREIIAHKINPFLPEGHEITKEGDLQRLLQGNAPTTAEYMERAGIPAGPRASDLGGYAEPGRGNILRPEKGGMFDPTLRGAVGLAGDVATDPLTYLGAGLRAARAVGEAKTPLESTLQAALNPVQTYAEGSAKRNYGKAFNYVDKQFPDKPQAVSEILRESGYVGSASGAAEELARINAKAGGNIGGILDAAADKGAQVNIDQALAPAMQRAKELRSLGTKEANAIADQIESRINDMKAANTQVRTSVPTLSEPKVLSTEQQLKAALNDQYNSVAQDKARVLETTTTRPQILKNGVPVSDQSLQGSLFGANPELTLGEEQTRRRAFTPLEVDPIEGQTALPLPENSQVIKGEPTLATEVTNNIPVNKANQIKTQLNSFTNFNPSDIDAVANQSRKAVAGPLSKGISSAVGETDAELLNRLQNENAIYSSTSPQVQNKMTQYGNQVAQQRGPLGWTGVDTMMAMGGLGLGSQAGHAGAGLLPVVGKKLLNAATSTEGRTVRGFVANKIAKSPLPVDATLRNAWEEMNNKENNYEK